MCNFNGIYESAAIWCVNCIMNKSATASFASRLYLTNSKSSDKREGMLFSEREAVNHLLKTYAAGDVSGKTEMEMQNFKMASKMTQDEY